MEKVKIIIDSSSDLTFDEIEKYNEQGKEVINVIDWLLEQN